MCILSSYIKKGELRWVSPQNAILEGKVLSQGDNLSIIAIFTKKVKLYGKI